MCANDFSNPTKSACKNGGNGVKWLVENIYKDAVANVKRPEKLIQGVTFNVLARQTRQAIQAIQMASKFEAERLPSQQDKQENE